MAQTLQRKLIWPGWFRLAHALIAISTLMLLATGYLIQHSPVLGQNATDLHHYAAGFLLIGIMIRFYFMVSGKPQERLQALLPKSADWQATWETLRFYLLLGKTPLPRWYAHNPLWKPLYLLIYLILLIQLISGILMQQQDVLFGFYLPSVHAYWASFVLWWVVLHLICSVWHDYASGTGDVSAMIHGYRLYIVDPVKPADNSTSGSISIDALRKTAQKSDRSD